MEKTPLEMNYNELDTLLNSLLTSAALPNHILYRENRINYQRQKRGRMLLKAVYRLGQAQLLYTTYVREKINVLKKTGPIFTQLKKMRCIKNLRTYIYLSKIGLTDLSRYLGGQFKDKLFADFALATMLYDAAFDIPICRPYLKEFDAFIMNNAPITSTDPYLKTFQDAVDNITQSLEKQEVKIFFNYVKIEHISQLMSIYQHTTKTTETPDLFKITYAKGGISALALMHIMAPSMMLQQRRVIYELGAVMQLIDDISDIKEDIKAGIQTPANQKLLPVQDLQQLYYGTINNLIKILDIDSTRPNETLDMLCWFADVIVEKRYKTLTKKQ